MAVNGGILHNAGWGDGSERDCVHPTVEGRMRSVPAGLATSHTLAEGAIRVPLNPTDRHPNPALNQEEGYTA